MVLFGDSLLFDTLVVISGLAVTIFTFFVYQQYKWTRRGIPYSDLHPLFGNIKDTILRGKLFSDVLRDFYLQHKSKPFIGFFTFMQPMVMINDLELLKKVLISDFVAFTDRNFQASTADPMEYHGMFGLRGQPWRSLRQKLTPTFTSSKMKMMFEFIDICGKGLVTCLEREKGESGDVDIKDFSSRFTADVISNVAFGIEGNSLKDPNSELRTMVKKLGSLTLLQSIAAFITFILPSLAEKIPAVITPPELENFVRKTVWQTVEYREKNHIRRNDFLSLLMQIRKTGSLKDDDATGDVVEKTNNTIDLEGDKFIAQCYLFLTAGFETSSSTMSFALYEMAINPDVQNRAYEEISTVLAKHDGKLTYEAVQEMTYLHMLAQETLRKYPLLMFLDRRVTQPFRLPGSALELHPGDAVMIPVIGLHYDSDIYPEPERFDPERFSEEQKRERPPCTFLGFGDGPRNCIGMRLGYLQAKVGLINILMQYEISLAPNMKTPLPFKNGILTQVDGGIHLRLKNRSA